MNTAQSLLSKLAYQYPTGITTMGVCFENCGKYARGGGLCADCVARELIAIGADKTTVMALQSAVEKSDLRQALAALMPILRDWEPDHSTGEERQKWVRAHAFVS